MEETNLKRWCNGSNRQITAICSGATHEKPLPASFARISKPMLHFPLQDMWPIQQHMATTSVWDLNVIQSSNTQSSVTQVFRHWHVFYKITKGITMQYSTKIYCYVADSINRRQDGQLMGFASQLLLAHISTTDQIADPQCWELDIRHSSCYWLWALTKRVNLQILAAAAGAQASYALRCHTSGGTIPYIRLARLRWYRLLYLF